MKNKRKTTKRLLAALLSCSMLMGLAAMPAAATAQRPGKTWDLLVVGIVAPEDSPLHVTEYLVEEAAWIPNYECYYYGQFRIDQAKLDAHAEEPFTLEIGDRLILDGDWVTNCMIWGEIDAWDKEYPTYVYDAAYGGHTDAWYEKQRLEAEGIKTEAIGHLYGDEVRFTGSPYVGHCWDKELGFEGFEDADTLAPVTDAVVTNGMQRGDLNGNGMVDILDPIILNKSLVGGLTLTDDQKAAADLDGSGSIDTTDGLLLLKAVVGLA